MSRPVMRASGSFSERVERQARELLDGIELSAGKLAQVLAIVAADSEARRELVRKHPERFGEQGAMIAERDERIRVLLETDSQRAQFDRTVERWRRIRSGEEPPPPAACTT